MLMFSTRFEPEVLLQEDSCTYKYGTVCFTCISISSLLSGMHVRLPEDDPSDSKHLEIMN